MATCKVETVKRVTLELTGEEADTLQRFLSWTSGYDKATGHRDRLNLIEAALRNVGFTNADKHGKRLPAIGHAQIYSVEGCSDD